MKMKYFKLIMFACMILIIHGEVCSQAWEWSTAIRDYDSQLSEFIKIDKNKNSYIGSEFMNLMTPYSLASNGFNDALIVKYDANGSLVWLKKFGGNNPNPSPPNYIVYEEQINSMCLDTMNNYLYASGLFYGSAQFGSTNLTSYIPNSMCMFFMKMDLDGNVIWAKRFPTNVIGMTTDNSGNLFFCGVNSISVILDSAHVISPGGFIAKYNSNGDCVWLQNKFRTPDLIPVNIKVNTTNIYINGKTNNDTIIVDTIVKYVPLATKWSALACFDLEGNTKWLSLYAGHNSQCGWNFSIDNNGNSYSTGFFTGTGYFGNDTLIATAGQKNMFLTKHDSLGHFLWAKQINATSSIGNSVSNVVDSTFYVTGWFKGTAHFNDSITASSAQDMFLAKYNANGTCIAAKNFGKAEGFTVEQDEQTNAFVTGNFSNSVTIGSNTFTAAGASNLDIFIAKLSGLTSVGNTSRLINTNNLLTIYANPNTGKCNITIPEDFQNEKNLTLQIFDLKGNQIQQAKIEMLDNKIKVNIEAEAKGFYNAVLTNGKKNYSGIIIFE